MSETEMYPWGEHWEYEPIMPRGLEPWTEDGLSKDDIEQHYATIAEFIKRRLACGETEKEVLTKYECAKTYCDYLERKKGNIDLASEVGGQD